MKVSIVTISYNQAKYLEEAIRSVVEQDHDNFEYIVVDPGSTDGSRDIIERYRDRIDKIIFAPDNGPADGLNKGFAEATGDIFGFLNSDDMLLPGALTQVVGSFALHSRADVISGHGIVVDPNGKEIRRVFSDRFNKVMAAYGACILVQPSTFFRSRIFRRIDGFNIANRSNWDAELFIDMSLHQARFKTVSCMISQYRVHSDSITGSAKLHELHLMHRSRMFAKILGRSEAWSDHVARHLLSYIRKLLNPMDTIERVLRGPIFGRAK
jgi:glycosyltransferase involved in cell wall biosynthesis